MAAGARAAFCLERVSEPGSRNLAPKGGLLAEQGPGAGFAFPKSELIASPAAGEAGVPRWGGGREHVWARARGGAEGVRSPAARGGGRPPGEGSARLGRPRPPVRLK